MKYKIVWVSSHSVWTSLSAEQSCIHTRSCSVGENTHKGLDTVFVPCLIKLREKETCA